MNERTLPVGRMRLNSNGRIVRLFERTSSNNGTVKTLQAAYQAALEGYDSFQKMHATAKADPRFTAAGVGDHVRAHALKATTPTLHRARAEARRARLLVDELRAKVKLPQPDPQDFAGAMRRIQVRQYLQDLKPDERAKYLASHGDGLPRETQMAILEMPGGEFSGLSAMQYRMVGDQVLAVDHGPVIEEIAEIEEAIAAVESMAVAAREEMVAEAALAGGAPPTPATMQAFALAVANVEDRTKIVSFSEPPWIRRSKVNGVEQDVVVDLKLRVERPATADDVANGVRAANLDEYQQQRDKLFEAA